jgi:hypothetical protein
MNKKEELANLLDKYLEPVYMNTTDLNKEEIRYLQREILKALEFYQTELIDNIPF